MQYLLLDIKVHELCTLGFSSFTVVCGDTVLQENKQKCDKTKGIEENRRNALMLLLFFVCVWKTNLKVHRPNSNIIWVISYIWHATYQIAYDS